jgi:aquaporin Z
MVDASNDTKTIEGQLGLAGGSALSEDSAQHKAKNFGLCATLAVEFIGTFALAYTAGGANQGGSAGVMLAVMIYAGGHVSGGHFNPCVTLAFFLRGGSFPTGQGNCCSMLFYIIVQYIGAALAAILQCNIRPRNAYILPYMALDKNSWSVVAGMMQETIFGFIIAYVVLHCATSHDNEGNDFYGLAIGGSVYAAGAMAIMNPAVAIGSMFSLRKKNDPTFYTPSGLPGLKNFGRIWPALLMPYVGGAIAAFVFGCTSPNDS